MWGIGTLVPLCEGMSNQTPILKSRTTVVWKYKKEFKTKPPTKIKIEIGSWFWKKRTKTSFFQKKLKIGTRGYFLNLGITQHLFGFSSYKLKPKQTFKCQLMFGSSKKKFKKCILNLVSIPHINRIENLVLGIVFQNKNCNFGLNFED